MEIDQSHPKGATPLDDEQLQGLKVAITTKGQLDEAEQANIIQGLDWALRARSMKFPAMLREQSIRELHRRMFGDVYTWAGQYRQRDTNVGADSRQIPALVHQL